MSIGFGILCFGEDFYFEGATEKIQNIIDRGYDCYILTDNVTYFSDNFWTPKVKLYEYTRSYKSYHDKLILPKYVLKENDICILIDADLTINDTSFFDDLVSHNFKNGISYVDTLLNHPRKKQYVSEFDMTNIEWDNYKKYVTNVYPKYKELELIWEYLLVINKNDFNQKDFYENYEILQLVKENCDLHCYKKVRGNGEGISISVASNLSNTPINRDYLLYEKIKNKIKNVSKKFIRPEHI